MAKRKSVIALIQELIDKGANTVEEIHRAIAEMPLKMLEKIDSLRAPARKASKVQDESIGAVYDLIREINEQVAKYATDLLAQARASDFGRAATRAVKRAVAAQKRPAKAAAAKKKPAKAAAKKRTAAKRPAG